MKFHTLILAAKITAFLSGMSFGGEYTATIRTALELASRWCPNPNCDCAPCTCDPCLCGSADKLVWLPYAEAYAKHKETHQTLVVLVTMQGCAPCAAMKDRVFPAVAKSGGFRGVLVTQVQYEDDPKFARTLMGTVKSLPLTILYKCDGNSCSRSSTVGQMDVETINRLIRATPVKATRIGYPIRNEWWSGCSSWRHLASGEHHGKFDTTWLASLSNAEIQSLHSDDHEGRVKWEYVVRPMNLAATTTRKQTVSRSRSYCPSCPR